MASWSSSRPIRDKICLATDQSQSARAPWIHSRRTHRSNCLENHVCATAGDSEARLSANKPRNVENSAACQDPGQREQLWDQRFPKQDQVTKQVMDSYSRQIHPNIKTLFPGLGQGTSPGVQSKHLMVCLKNSGRWRQLLFSESERHVPGPLSVPVSTESSGWVAHGKPARQKRCWHTPRGLYKRFKGVLWCLERTSGGQREAQGEAIRGN